MHRCNRCRDRSVGPIFLLATLLVGAVYAKEPEDTDRPYPYELPRWFEEIDARLRARIDHVEWKGTPLREALDTVESMTGLEIDLDDPDGSLADRPVRLAVERMRLENLLALVIQHVGASGLEVRRAPDRVVLTRRPEIYPVPDTLHVRRDLERARYWARQSSERRGARSSDGDIVKRLLERKASFAAEEVPLDEAVRVLRAMAGVNIVIGRKARNMDLGSVSVSPSGDTAKQVLDSIVRQARLDAIIRDGAYIITTREEALRERERRRQRLRRELERRRFLKQTVPHELRGKSVQEIVEPLSEALRVPVHADPESWQSTARIPVETAGASLERLQAVLRVIDVELVVMTPEAVYLVRTK